MEAQSQALPVVETRLSAIPELVLDGETGLLGDFFDEEGLASQALEVLRDPVRFRPLARAARQHIVERYSLDVVFPRLEALYRETALPD